MNYFEEIREMMQEAELDSVDFLWQYNKPLIQRDGIKHEILAIHAPEDGEDVICITTIPRSNWSLHHLYMDGTWPSSSLRHIRDVVKREIARMEEEG